MNAALSDHPAHAGRRLDWLDTAKGIALLLVIFGHTFRDSMRQASPVCAFLYDFVYSFHVPVFFFASGLSYALGRPRYCAQSSLQMIAGKLRAYMLPWFSYSLLMYLLFLLAQQAAPLARLIPDGYRAYPLTEYLGMMLRNENPYAFHLWYLYTAFLFFAFIRLIDRFSDDRVFRRLLIVLLLLANVCYLAFAKHTFWTVKSFFQQSTFFLLGVLTPPAWITKHSGFLRAAGLVSAAGIAALLLIPALVELGRGTFAQQAAIFVLLRLLVVALILGIAAFCQSAGSTAIGRGLARFGRESMTWYLYHQPFCCAVLGAVLYDALHLPLILCVCACFAASLLVPALILRLTRLLHLTRLCRTIGLPC